MDFDDIQLSEDLKAQLRAAATKPDLSHSEATDGRLSQPDDLVDHFDRLWRELSDERMLTSRWRGCATYLADAIIVYLRMTNPEANIPEWLYRHHPGLFAALAKHSQWLYGNSDKWYQEFDLGDH